MPRPPRPLPASVGDAFSRVQALDAGVTPRRLRGRDLEKPFHGARLRRLDARGEDGAPESIDRRKRERVRRLSRAFMQVMSAEAFFAGSTAAALLGAPLPDAFDAEADLCVATFHPRRAARGRGIQGVQVRSHLVTTVHHDGLPLTSPASTWAMLGGELSERWLVILGDYLVRIPRDDRGRPRPELQLTTIARLEAAAREPGRRHRARLLRALSAVRIGSFSRLETEYRLDAAASGLPRMELDVEIRDAGGVLLGIADGVYRRWGVIVEIEGDHHRTDRRQWNRDIDRLAAFVAEGWEVVRLTGARVRGGSAAGVVAVALRRHGWTASSPAG